MKPQDSQLRKPNDAHRGQPAMSKGLAHEHSHANLPHSAQLNSSVAILEAPTKSTLRLSAGASILSVLLVPLDAAFRSLGIGRTKGYELIGSGHLIMVKIGTKSLITADSLERFVASLAHTNAASGR
ncbi:hypothetical protein [Falsiroseomonas sp. E2-1-a4]|uniref:hypothetical protein n=1 Tax=Falsiroseomonas sp. E2-1-a4 TaxID=3239299 RepID=UPI003F3764AE